MTAIEFNHHLMKMESSLERFALSLTSNMEDALDLKQETFVKAITNREKYAEYNNFKAWLFTIMKNTFINNYRRATRENTTFDNTSDLYHLNNSKASSVPTPDSVMSAGEIEQAIDGLEDEFRVPFQMHQEGFKYKEIADELNLKIGTVKSRIFFGRKKLMGKIAN